MAIEIPTPKKVDRANSGRVAPHVQSAGRQQTATNRVQPRGKGLPTIDVERLAEFADAYTRFTSSTLGSVLEKIAEKYGDKIEVEYIANVNAFQVKIGNMEFLYIMGLDNPNSWVYQQARNIATQMYIGSSGNELTGYITGSFPNSAQEAYSNYVKAVIYEDDLNDAQKLQNIAYFIKKNAYPDAKDNYVVDDDYFVNQANGFHIMDSKSNTYHAERLKEFSARNSLNSCKIPGNFYIGIAVHQGRGFAQGPFGGMGGAGQFGGNPFAAGSGGFGASPFGGGGFSGFNQGGFGINQGGNEPIILGCVRYSVQEGTPATKDAPATRPVAKIHDIVELPNATVKHVLKHCVFQLARMGYEVRLELDLSKLSRTIIEDILSYFNLASQYVNEPTFKCLISYYNRASGARIVPTTFNISTFLHIHPGYDKDPKFPKSLKSNEDKLKFSEFVHKAGYVDVIHPGIAGFILTGYGYNSINTDLSQRNYAAQYGMTRDEYLEAYEAGEMQGKQPQQGNVFGGGGIFQSNGFGGGFGNQAFGGNNFGGGFGNQQGFPNQNFQQQGYPQYAQQGYSNQNFQQQGYPQYAQQGYPTGMQPIPMQGQQNTGYIPF